MKKLIILCLFAVGCTNTVDQIKLNDGKNGNDGYSSVLKTEPAGSSCPAGGWRLFFGLDVNRNGVYDPGDTPQSDFSVCNGVDGAPGVSPSVEKLAVGDTDCPSGGVKISTGSTTDKVCNGTKGDKGDVGDVGPSGPPGVAGTNSKPVRSTSYVITGTAWHPDGTSRNKYKTIFYLDNNEDGVWQSAIDTKLSEFEVYEGRNAKVVTLTIASPSVCPNGGSVLKVSDYMTPSQNVTQAICNGLNGQSGLSAYQIAVNNGFVGSESLWLSSLQGPQGEQGIQGEQGLQGVPADSQMVQLCPGDTANYPEYGIVSGKDLYGVYNDRTSGYTFLAKMKPGNWETTNVTNQANSCKFSYTNDGSYITLKNRDSNEVILVEL